MPFARRNSAYATWNAWPIDCAISWAYQHTIFYSVQCASSSSSSSSSSHAAQSLSSISSATEKPTVSHDDYSCNYSIQNFDQHGVAFFREVQRFQSFNELSRYYVSVSATNNYMYSVSQKRSLPHKKTFCNIFTHTKYISMKCCTFVASLYPCIFYQFWLIYLNIQQNGVNILRVLVVFTIWSFEFHQVRLL